MTTQSQYFQSLAELEATVSLEPFSYTDKLRFVADNLEINPYTQQLKRIADRIDETARLKENKSHQEKIYYHMEEYRAQQTADTFLSRLRSQGIEPAL